MHPVFEWPLPYNGMVVGTGPEPHWHSSARGEIMLLGGKKCHF